MCVDTDECVEGACDNDALCLQSSDNVFPAVPRGQYRCVCRPGFANGHCEYDYITEYQLQCNMLAAFSGSQPAAVCDVDVNECDSNPCQNGAVCKDSTVDDTIPPHAYRCECKAGTA